MKRHLKYLFYSRWFGRPSWNASYLFDRACASLKAGDQVIDAGANLGDITVALARTGATVHAFEPDPYAFGKLSVRTKAFANVVLYNKALSDQDGRTVLYRAGAFDADPDLLSQSSSIYADKVNVDSSGGLEIDTVSITTFLSTIPGRIKLLKLDVEGAEVPILEAVLAGDLMQRIDRIFAETHEKKIPQLKARTEALRKTFAERWPKRVNLDWH